MGCIHCTVSNCMVYAYYCCCCCCSFLVAYFVPIKFRIIPISSICASAIFGIILGKFNVLDAFSFLISFDMTPIERLSSYLNSQELNEDTPINMALRTSFVALFVFCFIDRDRINHWFSKNYLIGVIFIIYFVPFL